MKLSTKRPLKTTRSSIVVKHGPSGKIVGEKHDQEIEKLGTTASHVANVRHAVRLTMSLPNTYNSVSVEVSIEMPFPCKPGDTDAAARASKRVEAMVEARFAGKSREMKAMLKDIALSAKGPR